MTWICLEWPTNICLCGIKDKLLSGCIWILVLSQHLKPFFLNSGIFHNLLWSSWLFFIERSCMLFSTHTTIQFPHQNVLLPWNTSELCWSSHTPMENVYIPKVLEMLLQTDLLLQKTFHQLLRCYLLTRFFQCSIELYPSQQISFDNLISSQFLDFSSYFLEKV